MATTNLLPFYLIFSLLIYTAAVVKKGETVFVTDENFKNYRLEDFFWTGSGDGPVIEDSFGNETETRDNEVETETWKTTVFHTTTILFATVFPSPGECGSHGCTPQVSPVFTESIDFSSPASTVVHIEPTPTQPQPRTAVNDIPKPLGGTVQPGIDTFTTAGLDISEVPTYSNTVPPDQRYWLLTVLRVEEGPELRTNVLEERLARLYQRAFMRRRRDDTGQVRVTIHNATGSGPAPSRDVGLVYTVSVAGLPIPAISAAADMRLLTLSEVSAELGYPVLTKAEPYLKGVVPYGARVKGRTRDTWLLIGSVVAAVSLLVVLAALFTLGLSKKRALRSAKGVANRRQVFNGEEGKANVAFIEEESQKVGSKSARSSDAPGTVTFADQRRGSTSSSSCSGSSETSLVRLRMQQRRREMRTEDPRPKPRPRTTRVEDAIRHGGRLSGSRETVIEDDAESLRGPSPNKISTPSSYLSMPSVKAFPRKARIPEPLNRVLEPISIRHLDEDDDDGPVEARNENVKGATRHGSLEGDDPGVIGPVVWDRHCQHLNTIRDERGELSHTGRMRQRFSQLLDDTFSAFGGGGGGTALKANDFRSKSAVMKNDEPVPISTRPKTTDVKRPFTAVTKTPRGAWATPHCITPNRPLSAGVLKGDLPAYRNPPPVPVIDPQLILVDSELPPSDPAVPLIAAIKEELQKFKRTGSS